MQRKTLLYIGVGIGVLALIILIASMLSFGNPSLRGAVIDSPVHAAEVQLTDQAGQPFQLSAQRGRVVLLFFGYTNCPDECPLTMAHLKTALEGLGAEAQNVQVAMISTDPARDTPQALTTFVNAFNPAFLGLTGTEAQLQQAWQDYGVTVENGGEIHSTYIYVIDRQGNFRETFTPDTEPADIAADVSLLLKGK